VSYHLIEDKTLSAARNSAASLRVTVPPAMRGTPRLYRRGYRRAGRVLKIKCT